MENLPNELLRNVISFLQERDIVSVLCVSKRLRKVSQDNEFWRQICYDKSSSETLQRFFSHSLFAPDSIQGQATAALSARLVNDGLISPSESSEATEPAHVRYDKLRAMANWDPSYPGEKVDWYAEYITRHGPLSVSWTEPMVWPDGYRSESRGLGLYRGSQGEKRAVAPLDDGAVCLWDIDNNITGAKKRGSLISCSSPGLLSVRGDKEGEAPSKAHLTSTGVVECVRIDSFHNKGYIAAQNGLSEIDLETLQLCAHERYPFSISALSSSDDNLPTTIGTTLSLHLHDRRQSDNHRSDASETTRVETYANFPASPKQRNDFSRIFAGDDQPSEYAPLFQPGPLSIHHLTPRGCVDKDGEIYVAGRFPSVLVYDRRIFPRLKTNFHSGARLCSLTSLPYSFRALESDLMRKQQLSIRAVQDEKAQPGDRLIACGEYNGKGALEIYVWRPGLLPIHGLSPDRCNVNYPPSQKAGVGQTSTLKNRVSASRSKLLSCNSHGTRIVVSDSDGNVRWFERDGLTLVRSWNLNTYLQSEATSLFSMNYNPSSNDVARKLLPMNPELGSKRIVDDEILVWTGERIGMVGFTHIPRFGGINGDIWNEDSIEDQLKHREERIYGETMRRALERQADEARMMQGLGFGSIS